MGDLILGASGFLGSRIVEFLEKRNELISIGTNSKKLNNIRLEIFPNYRFSSDKDLENLVGKFETVIDASGISFNDKRYQMDKFFEINSIWLSGE